jgi:diguanylate cyclase (GGDEF)-like protein
MGGEEFAILLQDINKETAKNIAERIRANVEEKTQKGSFYNLPEKMTISIGLYFSTPIKQSSSEVIHLADCALYTAKNTGRNKVIVYA